MIIDNLVFDENGYLKSYRTTLNPDCEDTMDPITSLNDLEKYQLGATVLGDQCAHGSMTMSLSSKSDITNFFFKENPPKYQFITWDGGMDELEKMNRQSIFLEERR